MAGEKTGQEPTGVRPEFVIDLKGKEFVQYGGLLDLAHRRGLTALTVELVQLPTGANDFTAVCQATATLGRGEEARRFVDYGDATPSNVNRPIAQHLIRMASTRAKARVLRDATNIGLTALEEIGGGEEADPVSAPSPARPRPAPAPAGPATLTLEQNGRIKGALTRLGIDVAREKAEGWGACDVLLRRPPGTLPSTSKLSFDQAAVILEALEGAKTLADLPEVQRWLDAYRRRAADRAALTTGDRAGPPAAGAAEGRGAASGGLAITEAQVRAIGHIARAKGMTPQAVEDVARRHFQRPVDALSLDEASHVITELQRL